MLYVRRDRPVDGLTVQVLAAVDGLAKSLGLSYFVAGATARDILLTNVYGLDLRRATLDADFAIAVANWEQFQSVKATLIGQRAFIPDARRTERLYYRPGERMKGYPVDIIPFRGVERPPHTIAWPPDMKVVMNVAGYEDALAVALEIAIEEGLVVRVVSLPGLALLKLFAWLDRQHETPKDAQDLAILLRTYHEAGNVDRLYNQEIGTLEEVGFDLDLASPRLLGKDVRRMASVAALRQVRALMDDTAKTERLTTHMSKEFILKEDSIAAAERLLEQFKIGLTQA